MKKAFLSSAFILPTIFLVACQRQPAQEPVDTVGEPIRESSMAVDRNGRELAHSAGKSLDSAGASVGNAAMAIERNGKELVDHAGRKTREAGESVQDTTKNAAENADQMVR